MMAPPEQVFAVKAGVCNWCRAVAGIDCNRTILHHEHYYNDIRKGTIEICDLCHGRRHTKWTLLNPDITTNPIINEVKLDRKAKCHLCSFEWDYSGDRAMATCPNCMRKTPVKKVDKK
jgi:hypothetical protein